MIRQPERLGQRPVDLLVIGGGIIGAGIARDAALRGLSVALVEQGDFAGGTSSKTTKLIHGGLRYLEQFEFSLVKEALHERQILLKLAHDVVRPISFLLPIQQGSPRPAWKIRAGVMLYDWLAGAARLKPHRFYSAEALRRLEPAVATPDTVAAAEYYDAQMDDVRLCLENLFSAAAAGAVVVNHARVTRFHRQQGQIAGAEVESLIGSGSWLVQARVIVNATGPWADLVRRLADPHATPIVRGTKGIHIVYPRLPIERAVVLSARHDGRIFFLVPWREWTLIGTTDTDYDAAPESARATREDVDYLLQETNRLLPGLALQRERIITTFAGVRPLVAQEGKVPWHVSRAHALHEDPGGLLTIVGGKFTTYRRIAEQVVDQVARRLGRNVAACRTATRPFTSLHDMTRINVIRQLIANHPGLDAPLCPQHTHRRVEVRYAVEHESALTLSDVLWRRLQVGWAPCQGLDCAQAAAEIMAEPLGWDATGIHRQVETYCAEVQANRQF